MVRKNRQDSALNCIKNLLKKYHVQTRYYSFGKYLEYRLCIEENKADKKWVVYWAERGSHNEEMAFYDFRNACRYFLKQLVENGIISEKAIGDYESHLEKYPSRESVACTRPLVVIMRDFSKKEEIDEVTSKYARVNRAHSKYRPTHRPNRS